MKQAIANREVEVERFKAEHPVDDLLTVQQFAAKVLDHKKHSITGSTLHDYAKTLRLHILPHIGDRPFTTLTVLDLQEVISIPASEGKLNAADKARKVLGMLYRQAISWQLTDRNPADMLEPILKGHPKRGIWQRDETVRFLATGMRRGEVVSLRWSDYRNNRLYVEKTYSQVGNAWVMGPPKTRESRRALPVSPNLQAVLEEHRERLREHQGKTKRTWRDNGLLFPARPANSSTHPTCASGSSTTPNAPRSPLRFHDLRRIYATNFIREGGDPKQLQRRLGHATPDLAMSVYADTLEDDSEQIVFDLGDLFRLSGRPTPDPADPNDPEVTLEQIDELLASDRSEDD